MLFGVKDRPFVSATFHQSHQRFALEANIAVIYPDVEKKIIKIKVLNGFDSFLCYLPANMYGYVCFSQEAGHLSIQ